MFEDSVEKKSSQPVGKVVAALFVIALVMVIVHFLPRDKGAANIAAVATSGSSQPDATSVASSSSSQRNTAPAEAGAAGPQIASPSSIPNAHLAGFYLGQTIPQVADVLQKMGFPDAQCEAPRGIDYEDCATHKGSPDDPVFTALAVHLHPKQAGQIYLVEELFPSEQYQSVLTGLTNEYGAPDTTGGTISWKVNAATLILQRHASGYVGPDGTAYEQYRMSKLALADGQTVAGRAVDTMFALRSSQ